MVGGRVIFLPISQIRSRTSKKTGRIIRESIIEETAVPLRRISSSEIPTELVATWDNKSSATKIVWKYYEGSLWRPVLDPNGRNFESTDDFVKRADSQSITNWLDYPFQMTPYHNDKSDVLKVGLAALGTEPEDSSVFASINLLEVDDMLFKRAPGPVWSACREIEQGLDLGLNLIMPDYPTKEMGFQSFIIDDYNTALDFIKFITDQPELKHYSFLHRSDVNVLYSYERHASNFELPNECLASFRRTVDLIESNMRHLRIGEVPATMLVAYLQLIDSREIGRRSADHLGEPQTVRIATILGEYVEGARFIGTLRQTLAFSHIHILREIFEENLADANALISIR